ncbi:MAG: hypothetical protein H5U01_10235 [Clostridia bacterium]|nr:hypothetical protein [Clostridia bacterium]
MSLRFLLAEFSHGLLGSSYCGKRTIGPGLVGGRQFAGPAIVAIRGDVKILGQKAAHPEERAHKRAR